MAKRSHLRSNRAQIVKLSKKFLKHNQSQAYTFLGHD